MEESLRDSENRLKMTQDRLHEKEKKLKEKRRSLQSTDENLVETEEDLKREQRINEENEQKIKKAEEEHTRQKKKIEELESKVKKLNEENKKLDEESRKEKESLEKENAEIREKLEKLERYCEEMEETNRELIDKVTREKGKSHNEKEKKKRNVMMMDSNRKDIFQEVVKKSEDEWIKENDTYKTEDLERVNLKGDEDNIVIMLGTNNIKKGEDGSEEAEKYINQLKKIQKRTTAEITIVEIPPIGIREAKVERETFNRKMEKDRPKGIGMIKTPSAISRTSTNDLLVDRLHLNRETATQYAEDIVRYMVKNVNKERVRKNEGISTEEHEMTIRMKIEEDKVGLIIGKKGKNIMEIERQQRVRIQIENRDTIIIKGRNAKSAEKVIKEQIRESEQRRERNDERRVEHRGIVCSFYKEGKCLKGRRCTYDHVGSQSRTERSRSRGRGKERSPARERSSSRRYNRD